MSELATKSELLAPAKRRYREVTLPVQGGTVRLRSMSQLDRERYQAAIYQGDAVRSDAERRLVAACLVDADGDLMLTSDDDVRALRELDAQDMGVLYEACLSHCGFRQRDIEAMVGNSVSVADVDSDSASQNSPEGSGT